MLSLAGWVQGVAGHALTPNLPLPYNHRETGQKWASPPPLMSHCSAQLKQLSDTLGKTPYGSTLYGKWYMSRACFLSTCIWLITPTQDKSLAYITVWCNQLKTEVTQNALPHRKQPGDLCGSAQISMPIAETQFIRHFLQGERGIAPTE